MSGGRRTFLVLSAALVAWLGFAPDVVWAQERDPAPQPQVPEGRHRPCDERGDRPPRKHGPGMRHHRLPGGHLFRPLPEDEGPLTPDEQRELLGFVRRHVPKVYRWLKQIRQRDPAAFQKRLQEAAPRLRQLRRIFERDPELGRNVLQHAENLQRIHRARRAWRDAAQKPEVRWRIQGAVRRMLAENLQIEVVVLDDRVAQLKEQRDARVAAECTRLLSDDVDLAGEPGEVQQLVRRLQAVENDADREALQAELRQWCAERVDLHIARLQEFADHLRENAVEEVDQRLKRWKAWGKRGPGSGAPPKSGEQRERGARPDSGP